MAKELTLDDIKTLTEAFAESRNAMLAAGEAMNIDIEAVKEAHLATLTAAARAATRDMNTLYAAVDASRNLFAVKSAKSKVFAGITVGLRVGKFKVVAEGGRAIDAKALYETSLDARDLVAVNYAVIQSALNALPVEKLPGLGLCRVAGTESPLIKPVDADAAKIVDALIKEFVADDQ
jgi:hypothetical protein